MIDVASSGILALLNVTVTGGKVEDGGGGIRNLGEMSVVGCSISNNSASGDGGGIYSENSLFLANTSVYDNSVGYRHAGGGIYNAGAGEADLAAVAIYRNRASSSGNGGGVSNEGMMTLANATIFENVAANYGGGIDNRGTLTLSNVTVFRNTAQIGGGIHDDESQSITLHNTIVAGNSAAWGEGNPDVDGAFESASSHNLIGIIDGASGLNNGTGTKYGSPTSPLDPMLGALADNGGPTLTCAPFPGSPAIDAGDNAAFSGISTTLEGAIDETLLSLVVTDVTAFPAESPFQILVDREEMREQMTVTHVAGNTFTAERGVNGTTAGPHAEGATVTLFADQRGVGRAQDGDDDNTPTVDIGAFERFYGEIQGVRFHDVNGSRFQEPNEPGLSGLTIYLDLNSNGLLDVDEPTTVTLADDPSTVFVYEGGSYSFTGLKPGVYHVAEILADGWQQTIVGPAGIERVSIARDGSEAQEGSHAPSISADGRYVAFDSGASNLAPNDSDIGDDIFVYDRQTDTIERVSVDSDGLEADNDSENPSISGDGRFVSFSSHARNLVTKDNNRSVDIFVYDRQEGEIERVSVDSDGFEADNDSADPSISGDGRFVSFSSHAQNLVPNDNNKSVDIFVYERQTGKIERVSVDSDGSEADEGSGAPSISSDGGFVAFQSAASNLVPNDNNNSVDIFVYERQTGKIERVSVDSKGSQANNDSDAPSISSDGGFVAFQSAASNLVPDDNNNSVDIFVYERQTGKIERVSVDSKGSQANNDSGAPSISADGWFVSFSSHAENLVLDDTNDSVDIFVYDRQTGTIERVSVAWDGSQANDGNDSPSISADGRYVAFPSSAFNLVPDDTNHVRDIFVNVTMVAALAPSYPVDLYAGEIVNDVDFGNTASLGEIHGHKFNDLDEDGVKDLYEQGLKDWTVYLDLNDNGTLDDDEPFELTDADGNYSFTGRAPLTSYTIAEVPQVGWEQAFPGPDDNYVWTVYLEPAGVVQQRDFGNYYVGTGGQFLQSEIHGRLFLDTDGDETQDPDEPGLENWTVYLDYDDDRTRDSNEPQVLTTLDDPDTPAIDEGGFYSFDGLAEGTYQVRVTAAVESRQTTPLGNDLTVNPYAPGELDAPQTVVTLDIDQTRGLDLAVVNDNSNNVLLLKNDGGGQFTTVKTHAVGTSPSSAVVGDFDGINGVDLAVANWDSSNVSILLNDGNGSFETAKSYYAGYTPRSIAAGDFNHDGRPDLIVTNETDSTLSVLKNLGSGTFAAPIPFPASATPDRYPFSVVIGQFNDDTEEGTIDELDNLDLAVANFGDPIYGTDPGSLSIFFGDGNFSFDLTKEFDVGYNPSCVTAGDLDGDLVWDLAVANFLSDDVSILLNDGKGTFAKPVSAPTGTGPMAVTMADMEGDGDLDMIVTNGNSKDVSVLRNRGDSSFEPNEDFGVGVWSTSLPLSVAAADLDGNGTPDLAVANGQANSVSVLINAVVGGARRVATNGVDAYQDQDFAIQTGHQPPTLDPIPDPAPIDEDAGQQAIDLSVISAGPGEIQPLLVKAASSNTDLIPHPAVVYTSPDATGSLMYTPAPDRNGTATITVTVTDGGLDGDLSTDADNKHFSQHFNVKVSPINDPPTLDEIADPAPVEKKDAFRQTVNLTGITAGPFESEQDGLLTVTTDSDNTGLIPPPTVEYLASSTTSLLSYVPVFGQTGEARITVTVTDAGPDGTPDSEDDASFSQTFTVLVVTRPRVEDDTFRYVVSGSSDNVLGVLANDFVDAASTLSIVECGMPNHGGTVEIDAGARLLYTPAPGFTGIEEFYYRVTDGLGFFDAGNVAAMVVEPSDSRIVDRHVFYNNSAFDHSRPTTDSYDDLAIASDKEALLPGMSTSVARFANYTSYSRGINGIMVDVADLAQWITPIADDFAFRVGNDNNPDAWTEVTAEPTVTLRENDGTGDSDRITITWPDGTIRNTWLEVTVKAENLGLPNDDVFYFGNAVAESGNSTTDARITAADLLLARNNPRAFLGPAGISFPYDYNRDGQVNATDVLLARNNQTSFLNTLKLIDLSDEAEAASETLPASLTWLHEFVFWRDDQANGTADARTACLAVDKLLASYFE